MTYSLDTNNISYALKQQYGIRTKIIEMLDRGNIIVVPPISFYEIMRGLYANNSKNQINMFNAIFSRFIHDKLDRDDWLKAAEIYAACKQNGRPIADDDLFQAAFCIRHNYTLVTHNTKHFENIPGLFFEDWVGQGVRN
jgi:predicted nucleic acid-binding protein